ncbi:hypothetical protein SDC9_124331 [bioreactor metagenome]|uniref:Uncharacterized protein n=1 Tax=bioreactor metagenome TaxID=1076179 RepID=A0A645CK97_9ZZZZ
MGLRPADLRGVHLGARGGLDRRGGERHRVEPAPAGPADPRHGDGVAEHPGPRHPLLPSARPGLGERALGRDRRPAEGGRLRHGDRLHLEGQHAGPDDRGARHRQGHPRLRPAEHLHRRLLEAPGLPAASRGQPDGGGALPGRAPVPALDDPHRHRLRRQEPAPQFPRRRHGLHPRPQPFRVDQPGPDRPGRAVGRRDDRVRQGLLRARRDGHHGCLQGLLRHRGRPAELPRGRARRRHVRR